MGSVSDMPKRTALWILLALLGLVVAAGVTAAASRLSTQHVGLSSEPLSAGERLGPAARSSPPPTKKALRPPAHARGEAPDDGGGPGDD